MQNIVDMVEPGRNFITHKTFYLSLILKLIIFGNYLFFLNLLVQSSFILKTLNRASLEQTVSVVNEVCALARLTFCKNSLLGQENTVRFNRFEWLYLFQYWSDQHQICNKQPVQPRSQSYAPTRCSSAQRTSTKGRQGIFNTPLCRRRRGKM